MALRQEASTGQFVDDGTQAPTAKPAKNILHVKVWSPFHVYFDGEATSVSGLNGTGAFDILPRHHNFITLLNACDLQVGAPEGMLKIRISGGVMRVHDNTVVVFLEV